MDKTLGIYVHIPFCASKCAYCNFYSLAGNDKMIPRYQSALLRHIREAEQQLEPYLIDSVYFGGGTPSYYGASRLVKIFNTLKKTGSVLVDSEVTAEMNPDSTTYRDLAMLHRAGFNRLSIGVQCADDPTLKSIGRRHTFAQAEEAVKNARKAGFDNISIDLIYGLPSQTKESWVETLHRAAALHPEHISCYGLKIEEDTPLYIYKDSPFIPDDDTQADMYLYTVDALSRLGYRQYEISNFALRGRESRHNLKYWQGKEYMGFGAAAHSYIGKTRYSCIADVGRYINGIMYGNAVIDSRETVDRFEQASEYLMLGLRTNHGITEEEYRNIYPCSFEKIESLLKSYALAGFALFNNGRWSFTPQGFLLSNRLIGDILDAQIRQRMDIATPWKQGGDAEEEQISMFTNSLEASQIFNGIS